MVTPTAEWGPNPMPNTETLYHPLSAHMTQYPMDTPQMHASISHISSAYPIHTTYNDHHPAFLNAHHSTSHHSHETPAAKNDANPQTQDNIVPCRLS